MEKTEVLNISVEAGVKESAERILDKLGISMRAAVEMYLKQIAFEGRIPLHLSVPVVPDELNAALMTDEELQAAVAEGVKDFAEGRYKDLDNVFAKVLGDL